MLAIHYMTCNMVYCLETVQHKILLQWQDKGAIFSVISSSITLYSILHRKLKNSAFIFMKHCNWKYNTAVGKYSINSTYMCKPNYVILLVAYPNLYYTVTHQLFGGWKSTNFKFAKQMPLLKLLETLLQFKHCHTHAIDVHKTTLRHGPKTNTILVFTSCCMYQSLDPAPCAIFSLLHLQQCFN